MKAFLALFSVCCISKQYCTAILTEHTSKVCGLVHVRNILTSHLDHCWGRDIHIYGFHILQVIVRPTGLLNMLSQFLSVEKGVHLIPLFWSVIVQRRTQSMAILKGMHDRTSLTYTSLDFKP